LERIQSATDVYDSALDELLARRHDGPSNAELRNDFEVKIVPAKGQLDGLLTQFIERKRQDALTAQAASADARSHAVVIITTVAFLAVALAATLAFLLHRTLRRLTREREHLADSLVRVERSNRDLDAFAGRVAHDLRNALSPVAVG